MATDASTGTGLVFDPMEQFLVKPLFGGDVINWYTPTNVTLWMALAILGISAMLVLGTSRRAIIPSRSQSIGELAYGFVYKMVEDVTGKDGLKYFPYIMTLFMFIAVLELPGSGADGLHHHQPHRRDRRAGLRGVPGRHHPGLRQERPGLPRPVLGDQRAAGPAPDPGADRGHLATSCAPSAIPSVLPAT